MTTSCGAENNSKPGLCSVEDRNDVIKLEKVGRRQLKYGEEHVDLELSSRGG